MAGPNRLMKANIQYQWGYGTSSTLTAFYVLKQCHVVSEKLPARKQREKAYTCPPTSLATLYAFHVCSPAMHDSSKETATQNPELKKKREKGKQRENQCVPSKATSFFSRGETEKERKKSKSTK